ncbi:MAG TPA: hypothetical protein H9935_10380 [Candidatus Blautia merdigallinarum]|uniref:Uncharacterized protein n=1 Tax=Candidatus Blautia merdigallinarum TaxID=2838495 RepID=A0A9D2SL88_9FIRM|nr:hypothetical protein [Candidatus Blautia merdigallinarum]
MAKNYSNENNKNRSGAANSKNTFVENCYDRSENSNGKNAQNYSGSKNKNSASSKNSSKSEY